MHTLYSVFAVTGFELEIKFERDFEFENDRESEIDGEIDRYMLEH